MAKRDAKDNKNNPPDNPPISPFIKGGQRGICKWGGGVQVKTKIVLAFISFLCSVLCVPSTLLRTGLDSAFAFCYEEAGLEYNINPVLLQVISKTESNLNQTAINTNPNGTQDIGLMQINSSWVKSLNLDADLLLSDPCYNLKTGAEILSKCIEQYGYKWEAIGCYNAASKDKRVKYSWKIFNKLKEGSRGQKTDYRLKTIDQSLKSNVYGLKSNPRILESSTSSFFFNARDKNTMNTPSPHPSPLWGEGKGEGRGEQ